MTPSLRKLFKGKTCVLCEGTPIDICHIRSKGAGGTDEEFNLFPACRYCHISQHRIGFFRLSEKHPKLKKLLEEKGWRFELQFGVQKLVRAE